MFQVKDLVKLQKQAIRGLKAFYATEDGKAFFKYYKVMYVDNPSIDTVNINQTLINIAQKELIEQMYKLATNQSIIELPETTNE